jgi:hypothetical protein
LAIHGTALAISEATLRRTLRSMNVGRRQELVRDASPDGEQTVIDLQPTRLAAEGDVVRDNDFTAVSAHGIPHP